MLRILSQSQLGMIIGQFRFTSKQGTYYSISTHLHPKDLLEGNKQNHVALREGRKERKKRGGRERRGKYGGQERERQKESKEEEREEQKQKERFWRKVEKLTSLRNVSDSPKLFQGSHKLPHFTSLPGFLVSCSYFSFTRKVTVHR